MELTLKIISFSLFGSAEKYRIGLLKNLEIAASLFADWTCFVYCDEINYQALCGTPFSNAKIIRQAAQSDGLSGMAWRLNACNEPAATAVIFRDTDSLLGEREKEIVDEWLTSNHDIHLIRDHPLHFSPVMGGMFGVKNTAISLLAEMVTKYHKLHRQHAYGDDQDFLNRRFYPLIKHKALVHTSSVRYLFEFTLPIRACREGELFIGAYEFASETEQAMHRRQKDNTPAITCLPHHWQRKRILKVLFKRIQLQHIHYGCLWCI